MKQESFEIECRGCGDTFTTYSIHDLYCEQCEIDADNSSQRFQDQGEAEAHMNGSWA